MTTSPQATSPQVVRRGAKWAVLTPAGTVQATYDSQQAAQTAAQLGARGFQFGGAA